MPYAPTLNIANCIPDFNMYATVNPLVHLDLYRTRIPVHEDTIRTLAALRYIVKDKDTLACMNSSTRMRDRLGNTNVIARVIKNYRDTDVNNVNTIRSVINAIKNVKTNLNLTLLNTYGATPEELTELEQQLSIAGYYLRDDYATAIVASVNHKATLWQSTAEGTNRAQYVLLSNMCNTDIFVKLIGAVYSIEKILPVDIIEDILTMQLKHIAEYVATISKEYEAIKESLVRAQKLAELSTTAIGASTQTIEGNIVSTERTIADKAYALNQCYQQLASYKNQLFIALTAPQQTFKDLADYLAIVDTKILTKIDVRDSRLFFTIKAPLLFWEEQPIKDMLKSTRENCINTGDKYQKQMIENIFINKTITLMTELRAFLHLNKNNTDNHCVYRDRRSESDLEKYDLIAHPHIYWYNCWGDNAPIIDKAYYNFQFDIMFAQIQSVANSVNTSDIAVIKKLMWMLYTYASVCTKPSLRINETGEMISPKDYVARLKKEAEQSVIVARPKRVTPTPLTMVEPGAPNTPVLNDNTVAVLNAMNNTPF